MTGSGDKADATLWRRWRLEEPERNAATPDPLALAAYAEGRLADEAEAATVENWLTAHPSALDDVLAARAAAPVAAVASERVVSRAAALVQVEPAGGDTVVPFPARVRRPVWQTAAMWGGLAASLAVTSFVGFGLGNSAYDAYDALATQPSVESAAHDLIDPPSALFESDGDPET